MTGRDMIIYILKNGLEDEELFQNGCFMGFMSAEEVAAKFDVGVSTVMVWYELGMLKGIEINGSVFFMKDTVDPRKDEINK